MHRRLFGPALFVLCLSGAGRLQAEEAVRVAKDAQALYEVDEKAREAFEKKFPNTLPESKRKLPKATAKSFDWSKHGVTGLVYTQGKTPYCWAYAAVEAFECNWRLRNKTSPVLAVQPIIDHTKAEGGAHFSLGMKALVRNGTALLTSYPPTRDGKPGAVRTVQMKYRAVAYGHVGQRRGVPSPETLKEALLKHGPLVVGVYAGSDGFKKYKGGLYAANDRPPAGEQPVNHAVLLVGWDDKSGTWKIKNSWNTTWGEGGYMRIKYGSNNVGFEAMWIRAQSTYYHLPTDAHTTISGDAAPFHRWPAARDLKLKS